MSRLVVRSSVFAMLVAVVALLAGVFAGPASAHSALIGSNPDQGAKIDTAPERVVLTFNEDIKPAYATLVVVGPDNNYWQKGEPVVSGAEVSVPLQGLGQAGEYKINYRVTSADGHPIEGQRTFELTAAGNGQPGQQADDWQPEVDDHGVKAWMFIVGGVVVVLLVAGALALMVAKRRR